MRIKDLSIQSLNIPFKQSFAHASAIRAKTESVLVTVVDESGVIGFGEGCPRSYVTGETVASVEQFVELHRDQWITFTNCDDMRAWIGLHGGVIDENPAGWCAVETAVLDLLGKKAGRSIDTVLDLPPLVGIFQYSAVLGTEDLASFKKQLQRYLTAGFADFKVKVTGRLQDDIGKLEIVAGAGHPNIRVRLDANNHWSDAEAGLAYLKQLPGRITAIEEPLKVGDYDGCRRLAQELKIPIILDESFLRVEQFVALSEGASSWIINIRVSKMGGILRSLTVAQRAKEVGIPIIIGAQVGETSILTRVALTVANKYRDILIAQEGAFGTLLLERDLCEPPLMFGTGGRLDAAVVSGGAGLGLASCEIQGGNDGTC
jgi:L-Ala-D/L-Glu epimerase